MPEGCRLIGAVAVTALAASVDGIASFEASRLLDFRDITVPRCLRGTVRITRAAARAFVGRIALLRAGRRRCRRLITVPECRRGITRIAVITAPAREDGIAARRAGGIDDICIIAVPQWVGVLVRIGGAASRAAVDGHRAARTGRLPFIVDRITVPECRRLIGSIGVAAPCAGMAGISARCAGGRDRLALIAVPHRGDFLGIAVSAAGTDVGNESPFRAGGGIQRCLIIMP